MRIRNAAVAGATALAVAFAGTTVASAQDSIDQGDHTVPVEPAPSKTGQGGSEDETPSTATGNLSSDLGQLLEGDQAANGVALFGSSKDFGNQPAWAKVLYGVLIAGGIGTVLGGVIGPVYNFIVHGPFSA